MLDIVSVHLSQSASPETQAAIEEALDFFEDFSLPEYQDRYTELMMSLDNEELGEVVQAIAQLTLNLQHVMLQNFQIEVAEDATISQLNLILRTLQDLENTEMIDEVKTICGEETDPVEAFTALMQLIIANPYETADTYHGFVHTVTQSLIDKILETTEQRVADNSEDEIIDIETDKKLVETLTKFMSSCGLQGVMIHTLIHDGLKLNIPFHSYYEKIIDFLSPTEPVKMAIELYAAFLVSTERNLNPRAVIGEALQNTFAQIDVLTPVSMAIDSLVLKAHITQTSGIRKD